MDEPPSIQDSALEFIRTQLAEASPNRKHRRIEKVILAILGSIPWVGGFLSAAMAYRSEEANVRLNDLQGQWLEEHAKKIERLMATLKEMSTRLDSLGEEIEGRIASDEYLSIVRKSFRVWDTADTDEKRTYAATLVTNAAGIQITSDDVIRLFLDWLDNYHEAHFAVIREIYTNRGVTRYDIWEAIRGEFPREDSAEADLFRLLIRDLSTGGVIRQVRDVNELGQFMKRSRPRRNVSRKQTMESAFEDTKPYTLTELGQQFVHYTMEDLVLRIQTPSSDQ